MMPWISSNIWHPRNFSLAAPGMTYSMKRQIPFPFYFRYLSTFNFVYLRAQQEMDRLGGTEKEYVWAVSFPDCTPALRTFYSRSAASPFTSDTKYLGDFVNRWIRHHFCRNKRAKCLIVIGPSGTGKSSFALSLPGRVNYFKERWNLDKWTDYARYSVYDDVPWDDFSKLNYPNKKGLLTQNGKINVSMQILSNGSRTDVYLFEHRPPINTEAPRKSTFDSQPSCSWMPKMPAHSSLGQLPSNRSVQQSIGRNGRLYTSWVFIYIRESDFVKLAKPTPLPISTSLGQDEHFYKKDTINTNPEHTPVSSNSSVCSDHDRIGDANEFEQTRIRWENKPQHTRK